MNFLRIGCDPEIFLQDAAGAYISAIGKIGGSKEDPRPLPLGDGYAVQEDNVALEFNIPAAESSKDFVASIALVREFLSKEVNDKGLKFSRESATLFPWTELASPKAMEFGCDPDFNAWTLKRNPKPNPTDKRLRSAGGHVHVGYNFQGALNDKVQFIKHMDLYVGVPSMLMDNGQLRKELYGKAGAFRSKPYGVEYRTLSNYWIFEDRLVDWVWRNTEQALWAWDRDTVDIDEWGPTIQEAINNNNLDAVQSLVDHFDLDVQCSTH